MMTKRILCIWICLQFISHWSLGQAKRPLLTHAVNDTIPFQLTSHNNISMQAILNKTDTLDLMFHTAAQGVSLVEGITAQLTSLHWDQMDSVNTWGGAKQSRSSSKNVLHIGASDYEGTRIWETKHSGPLTDGKFGLDIFENQIVELNYDLSVLVLHASLPPNIGNYEQLDLHSQGGGLLIEGNCILGEERLPQKFLIHSGYGSSLLLDDVFVKTHSLNTKLKVIAEKELKDSHGNIIKTQKALLEAFELGSFSLSNIPAGFFAGTIGRQRMSVLGGDVLKRFNIIWDANRTHLYLRLSSLNKMAYTNF